MKFYLHPINKSIAKEILKWKYDPPYDFYNNSLTDETLQEVLENNYISVFSKSELFGFFLMKIPLRCQLDTSIVYRVDQVDIGLGIAPTQTGRGNAEAFLEFIFQHAKTKYGNKPLRLTVASFNKRAIHLYEKMGFEKTREFTIGQTLFFIMVKNIECFHFRKGFRRNNQNI